MGKTIFYSLCAYIYVYILWTRHFSQNALVYIYIYIYIYIYATINNVTSKETEFSLPKLIK